MFPGGTGGHCIFAEMPHSGGCTICWSSSPLVNERFHLYDCFFFLFSQQQTDKGNQSKL